MPRFVRLTEAAVNKLRAAPGLHCVDSAAALYLRVPTQGKGVPAWLARVTAQGGNRSWRALGSTVKLGLPQARAAALEAGKAASNTATAPQVPTFREAAAAYIDRMAPAWKQGGKSRAQWEQSLNDYAMPVLGELRLPAITTDHVLQVLQPLWADRHETAQRLRQRIAAVLQAESRRLRLQLFDVANLKDLEMLLPRIKVQVQHHPAPTLEQLRNLLPQLTGSASHRALRLVALTGMRSGEVRGLRWADIDQAASVLRLPGERMKNGQDYTAPLTAAALACIGQKPKADTAADYVFRARKSARQLSDMSLLKVLRDAGLPFVVHGIRAAFKTWATETGQPHAVAEMQLAHARPKLERAYQRSDLLQQRLQLLAAWEQAIGAAL